jgi:hypothetical protein
MADLGAIGRMGDATERHVQGGAWALQYALRGDEVYRHVQGSAWALQYAPRIDQPMRHTDQGPRWMLRSLMLVEGQYEARGIRNNVQGSPLMPSLEIQSRGRWRFRWVVPVGARTISIRVKQPYNLGPRPTLTVKANPLIGLPNDAVGTAPSGSDWVTIGPVAFVATSAGPVWVELNTRYEAQSDVTYWDHLVRT